jgi:flavin reductase (DIM6/NTAB) family NADH-FMN oxidoreductase RutF
MEKQIWKPGTLLAPVPPVLVSCGTVEEPNALTIGWTGIINTIPPMTYISVRPERFSHSIIKESGEFVINLPTKQLVRAVDFCGVRSGKTVKKFEHCGLTAMAASQVSAPIIGESPVSLECKVEQVISLGSHDMFIAKILCIDVDESIVDANGRLCLEKAGLITYAHGTYYELGKALGTFGYTVQKKKKNKKKPQAKAAPAKK